MPPATLIRIMKELKTLDAQELLEVQRAVEDQILPNANKDTEEKFFQSMLEAGLITEIKRPDRTLRTLHQPVPILGKPLSETIIEDRR